MPFITRKRDEERATKAARRVSEFHRMADQLASIGATYTATESGQESTIAIGHETFHFNGWAHRTAPGRFRYQTTWSAKR